MTQSFLEPVKRILETTAKAFKPVEPQMQDPQTFPPSKARIARDSDRARREEAKQLAAETRAKVDLKFIYLPQSRLTVAYEEQIGWKRVIKIATSLAHSQDQYSERLGRMYSAAEFGRGHTIKLLRPKGLSTKEYLTQVFGN